MSVETLVSMVVFEFSEVQGYLEIKFYFHILTTMHGQNHIKFRDILRYLHDLNFHIEGCIYYVGSVVL